MYGTFANFIADTTVPASRLVQVSDKLRRSDGTIEKVTWAGFSLIAKKQLLLTATSPTPNTRYYYAVTAKDKDGFRATRSGSFRTRARRVTIKFQRIHVIDDSDELSAGDLTFAFFAGKPGQPSYMEAFRTADGWKPGATYYPSRTFVIDNAPAEIPILVVGRDIDEFSSCGLKMTWFPPTEGLYREVRLCVRYGWVRFTLEVSRNGPASPETFVAEFLHITKYSNAKGALVEADVTFSVKGRVIVEYFTP